MEKLIYLLGDTPPGSIPFARSDLRDAVFGVWPALERVGVRRADLTVADLEEGDVGAVQGTPGCHRSRDDDQQSTQTHIFWRKEPATGKTEPKKHRWWVLRHDHVQSSVPLS